VNTSELVTKIAEAHSLSKTQAQAIVDSMLKAIMSAAANGEEISLPGFGKFKVKETPEREGRNPTSGEKIKIAASRKPKRLRSYSTVECLRERARRLHESSRLPVLDLRRVPSGRPKRMICESGTREMIRIRPTSRGDRQS